MSPQDLPRPHSKTGSIREVSFHQWFAGCCFLILLGLTGVTALAAGMGMEFFWLTTEERMATCALKSTQNPRVLWPARVIRIPQQGVTSVPFHPWNPALEPFKQAHNFILLKCLDVAKPHGLFRIAPAKAETEIQADQLVLLPG